MTLAPDIAKGGVASVLNDASNGKYHVIEASAYFATAELWLLLAPHMHGTWA